MLIRELFDCLGKSLVECFIAHFYFIFFLSNYCVELKREATVRSEIRDKAKEEQSAPVTEDKGLAEQTHSETPPQTTDNIKQEQ